MLITVLSSKDIKIHKNKMLKLIWDYWKTKINIHVNIFIYININSYLIIFYIIKDNCRVCEDGYYL